MGLMAAPENRKIGASEQQSSLSAVAGEFGGTQELGASFRGSSQLLQKVTAHRWERILCNLFGQADVAQQARQPGDELRLLIRQTASMAPVAVTLSAR